MRKFPKARSGLLIAPLLAAALGLLASQAPPPDADESGIVPAAFKVVEVELESQVSPTAAAVRYARDGATHAEEGERSSYPFIHPLQGQAFEVCREFGLDGDGSGGKASFHPGMDFRASEGLPVIAAAAGKVEYSGYTNGYGIYMVINHGSFSTLYAHLRKDRPVKKGQTVAAGQRIASVGSTGDTREALLHYEIRLSRSKSGVLYAVDPRQFLEIAQRAGSRGSAASIAYGADVLAPRFSFKEGKVTVSCEQSEDRFSATESPENFPLRNPLGANAGKVETGFGLRSNPFTGKKEFHTGIDIPCFYGCPVLAAGAGTVAKTGYDSGYGDYAIIRHGDIVTLYAHLKDLSLVAPGKRVYAGQRIGVIGNTGKTTGPHLHYEIRLVTDRESGFKESVKRLFDPKSFLDWAGGLGIR